MLGNAFLLSVIYLAIGLAVDGLRRWYPAEWVDRMSLVVDSLPGRTLLLLDLMPWVREVYFTGRLPGYGLRLIFAGTTVAIIFALAFLVGGGMWLVQRAWEWHLARTQRRGT